MSLLSDSGSDWFVRAKLVKSFENKQTQGSRKRRKVQAPSEKAKAERKKENAKLREVRCVVLVARF